MTSADDTSIASDQRSLQSLIGKLEDWREYDFHADRQLADEVLIADGWKVAPNPAWEGGVRWFLPGNPEISVSESHRAHVIHDLDTALGVVPFKHSVCLLITDGKATATVWMAGEPAGHEGKSQLPTLALLIASLKAKQSLLGREVAV